MFASNTGISTSHNNHIVLNKGETRTFRILLHPTVYGRLDWKFMFSNTVDSTWDDGSVSYADLAGGNFEITASSVCAADEDLVLGAFSDVKWKKTVIEPRECVWSEKVTLDIPNNGYIVFSWCLTALNDNCVLPSTPDSQALCYTCDNNAAYEQMAAFTADQNVSVPDLFAADRDITAKMVFMGDSITQGCGTRVNYYEQWATRIALGMDKDISVWNIGLGFGRGGDAARDGAWLKKAKQADVVNICFGVNDIFQTRDAELLINNLRKIVELLHENGTRAVLFTVPPFDMQGEDEKRWRRVVDTVRNDGLGADAVFDIANMLCQPIPNDHMAAFGGHPDGRGGAAVAGEYLSHFWPRNRERLLKK